jgi:electron transfer flavoprotein beta subunit
MKKLACLVSIGAHPVSREARYSRNDSLALGLGLAIAKDNKFELEVLHAGDADNRALNDYHALGADNIKVLPITDNANVVTSLASQLQNTELILTGTRAESSEDSGLLPYLLAEKLQIPLVNYALDIEMKDGAIEVLQFLPKGKRRRVSVTLPAVVTVHPLATVKTNYVFAKKVTGNLTKCDIEKNEGFINRPKITWTLAPNIHRPNKLKASENITAHRRMLSAISSESKSGLVVNEGTSVEKAQVILTYLREHYLINF